ncbi:MAG: hypothetical protein COV74_02220 [Candidatus Omnitrophica bacterium CG11_big_fil_rev_8_21_14_0_20_45_26]|uniref:Uncharacterized protein n=1 Tax=Candidatus Abzuiibacterium crystallinum TaxID=1974748 RepID=A0A2H0LRX9_9BACT|nr:MAG: hypothetical protein COV74_02220 [Candidatus Omnitrophica bacterium CG11_big_fil_rev_8_21_14_0_20_45_26]PIW64897.1 MAG: hypothetical protein COW12_04460 [Candidatus Omnitrophica bacterium CG12_big_fil_rev_8_21_14_0_65_45_16]
MKNTALKTSGVIFLLLASAQLARFILNVQVTAGTFLVPVWLSAVVAVALFALAFWMFQSTAK